MGKAKIKPFHGIENTSFDPDVEYEFERNKLLGRVIVDFDPGPELRIGIYQAHEFAATFDVVEE